MQSTEAVVTDRTQTNKAALWIGWILSILIALFIGSGGVNAWIGSQQVIDGTAKLGYSPSILHVLGTIEIVCALVFLVPQTAALGAILLTGFFGGAVASHARIGDPMWVVPVVFGLLVWVALLLRMPRFHLVRPSRY